MIQRSLGGCCDEAPPGRAGADPFEALTEREIAVLRLLAEGKSNAHIAAALVLSAKTVRNHVSTILSKRHVDNRVEAATYAVQYKIHNYQRGGH